MEAPILKQDALDAPAGPRGETSCGEAPCRKTRPAPERLTRRADFVAAAKGKRFHAKGFTLQTAPRQKKAAPRPNGLAQDEAPCAPRFGFTVTKKLGGAVLRNRIRRRLKEALRRLDPLLARAGHDYVILARSEALGMAFSALQAELSRALEQDPQKGKPAFRKAQGRPNAST